MLLLLLPLLGICLNSLSAARVEANLTLGFKTTKQIQRQHSPANCTVGNATYAHGTTFKLDCKTQCVCENGRHACSSLCPKEQLPAPEDTISCRSPRLVEVPGHCCRMWLCENPTADVYATCHNSSTSPWTPCSRACGMGISTRFASTAMGCNQLSSLRLCENRKCDQDNKSNSYQHQLLQQQQEQFSSFNANKNLVISHQHRLRNSKDNSHYQAEHKVRKGHECRSIQHLGPARIRLGTCISRKLYRPKLCGRCHHASKCCVPSVSTTIQVELLCPLNAVDPISYAERQQESAVGPLWDTLALEPINQEYLQSHQIQIENKYIAVEWILKCECGKKDNCFDYKGEFNKNNSSYALSNYKSNNNNNNRENKINTNHFDDQESSSWQTSSETQPDIIPYPLNRNDKTKNLSRSSSSSGKRSNPHEGSEKVTATKQQRKHMRRQHQHPHEYDHRT